MYMRNRYYDPATGQFTQPDPIGLAGGLNSYGFAAGDPVSYADPYGLAACEWCKRALAAAGDNAREFGRDIRNAYVEGGVSGIMGDASEGGYPVIIAAGGSMGAPQPRFLTGVQLNRAVGLRAEAMLARQLVDDGYTILGSQVTVRTAAGRRVVDHIVQTPQGNIAAIEVKAGNASRSTSQMAKDHAMATSGGIPVGKNAPDALRGRRIQMQTEEWRVP